MKSRIGQIGLAVAWVLGMLSFVSGVNSYADGYGAWYPLFGASCLAVITGMWIKVIRTNRKDRDSNQNPGEAWTRSPRGIHEITLLPCNKRSQAVIDAISLINQMDALGFSFAGSFGSGFGVFEREHATHKDVLRLGVFAYTGVSKVTMDYAILEVLLKSETLIPEGPFSFKRGYGELILEDIEPRNIGAKLTHAVEMFDKVRFALPSPQISTQN